MGRPRGRSGEQQARRSAARVVHSNLSWPPSAARSNRARATCRALTWHGGIPSDAPIPARHRPGAVRRAARQRAPRPRVRRGNVSCIGAGACALPAPRGLRARVAARGALLHAACARSAAYRAAPPQRPRLASARSGGRLRDAALRPPARPLPRPTHARGLLDPRTHAARMLQFRRCSR